MEEPTPGSSLKGLANLSTRFEQWAIKVLQICVDFLWLVYAWKWVIGIVILLGFNLIILRETIIAMLPFLAHHLKLTADFANAIVYVLDALKLVVDEIRTVINAAASLFGGKLHATKFVPLKLVSTTEISTYLIEIATVCTPMNNGFKVTTFIMREFFNDLVCPGVRSLQPTIFGHIAHAATSGLTYSPDPTWPKSCTPLVPPAQAWVCASFGSGFVLLEVITPLIFVGLIGYTTIKVAAH
jgi:hypothetical protein